MEDLPRLSPAQLLIAQFTPDATRDLCAEAGRQFLTQAASYQKGQFTRLECKVFKLERHGGDVSMGTEEMVLIVEKDGLKLKQRSEELFSCAGDQIGSLKCELEPRTWLSRYSRADLILQQTSAAVMLSRTVRTSKNARCASILGATAAKVALWTTLPSRRSTLVLWLRMTPLSPH